jgi:hypothetical protein
MRTNAQIEREVAGIGNLPRRAVSRPSRPPPNLFRQARGSRRSPNLPYDRVPREKRSQNCVAKQARMHASPLFPFAL